MAERRREQPPLLGKPIKLVVWDLDDTLWRGVLLENDPVALDEQLVRSLVELDGLGVLHSVASRNNHDDALAQLRQFKLDQYFLYPQIGFGAKSKSVERIVEKLRIGADTVLFVDDQAYERAEVAGQLPDVRCIAPSEIASIILNRALLPHAATMEAKRRRAMYREQEQRDSFEETFEGPPAAFLKSLDMKLSIECATMEDLLRAEELTLRTNQLNSTGVAYNLDEFQQFIASGRHDVLMVGLADRFGDYGKIGVVLIEKDSTRWTLKLFLLSCRVLSRGIGGEVIHSLLRRARQANVAFEAEFKPTGRNKAMHLAYKMSNFQELRREGALIIYGHDLVDIPDAPAHLAS